MVNNFASAPVSALSTSESSAIYNTGEIRWLTHFGQNTRDNLNSLDPGSQIDAVNANDTCSGVTTDSSGNVYCVGSTNSSINDTNGGSLDAFVMKLNSSGVVQWVTQLGTSTRDNTNGLDPNGQVDAVNSADYCTAVAVDSSENVFCVGNTSSSLNDTAGGGNDIFVMKLNSSGVVQWVTQLGTDTRDNLNGLDPNGQVDAVNGSEVCNSIAIDSLGNIYCGGYTDSSLNDSVGGSSDAFVMKLNSSGVVQWLTQLGTGTRDNTNSLDPNGQVDAVNGFDQCSGITIDSTGNVFCAGSTTSSLNDTAGGIGSSDAFVMKLNSSGVVQWITQLGTGTRDNTNGLDPNGQVDAVNLAEFCRGVVLDAGGNVICGGRTNSSLNDTNGGGTDAFVMQLNSSGVVQWITQLGTGTRDNTNGLDPNGQVDAVNGNDDCMSFIKDADGSFYCGGNTSSALNDSAGGSADAFAMKLNSSGVIQWLTHLGTGTRDNTNGLNPYGQVAAVNGIDYCNSMAVDSDGNVYCGGDTASALNDTAGGGTDAFVVRLQ